MVAQRMSPEVPIDWPIWTYRAYRPTLFGVPDAPPAGALADSTRAHRTGEGGGAVMFSCAGSRLPGNARARHRCRPGSLGPATALPWSCHAR